MTVVANSYRGIRLNRPNDVVVKSDGSIYFTDPGRPAPDVDLDFSGVYRRWPCGSCRSCCASNSL
ncbi:MAG: hypothetical protein J4O08_09165 [Chloroflexi bacterium]|nr:hypothetical protein [Chloroflexota bacterium]